MGTSATSWGLGGYLRFHVNDRVRIAERYEFMNDREARSTGVEQMLMENTITLEFQPVVDDARFLTRLEYRRGLVGRAVLQLLRLRRGTLDEPEHLHHRDVLGLRPEVRAKLP